ncbi:unnamed protein product [Dicrocoelium dendriticum]|nr:unnamed protein product [Dicrocoelium dendriticum]
MPVNNVKTRSALLKLKLRTEKTVKPSDSTDRKPPDITVKKGCPSSKSQKVDVVANHSNFTTIIPTDTTDRIIALEEEVATLKCKLHEFSTCCEQVLSFCELLRGSEIVTLDRLSTAASLLDSVTSETQERLRRSHNVIIFNVPDKPNIDRVTNTLLEACNMDEVSCQCLRLRKKDNMTTYPILLQFPDNRSASKFVGSKRLVAAQTNFKNIIIKHDQTPLQRRLTMKQNPSTHHIPHVPTNETSTDAIISNVDLDKSPASSNIGDDGHHSLQRPHERISTSNSDVSKTKTTNQAEHTTAQTPADHTLNSPIPSPNCEPLQQFTVTVPETYRERDKKSDCDVGSLKNKSQSDPNELSYRLSPTNRCVGKNRGKHPARISPISTQSSLGLEQPPPERRDMQLGQPRKSIRPQASTCKTDTVVGISCREPDQYLPTMPLTTFPNPATSSWQSPYVCDTELANEKLVGRKDLQVRGCNPYLPQVKIHPPPPAVLPN